MKATIYHNPSCSKSRHALERLAAVGADVTVVEYLTDTPDRESLALMIRAAGLTARQAVRTGEPAYATLGLADADDEALLDALIAHPELIQRPLVRTDLGTAMARDDASLDRIL